MALYHPRVCNVGRPLRAGARRLRAGRRPAAQVRKPSSWPRSWANFNLYGCSPTGMHGPACTFWADLTPFSLQAQAARRWWRRRRRRRRRGQQGAPGWRGRQPETEGEEGQGQEGAEEGGSWWRGWRWRRGSAPGPARARPRGGHRGWGRWPLDARPDLKSS
jgi:hypothetical protein